MFRPGIQDLGPRFRPWRTNHLARAEIRCEYLVFTRLAEPRPCPGMTAQGHFRPFAARSATGCRAPKAVVNLVTIVEASSTETGIAPG